MTPLIKNLNSSSLARILFYDIKSNQLLMKENLVLIFNPYPLNFELSLDQNQHPPLEKRQNLTKKSFQIC
ncbi:hypothetical protein DD749_07260 [Helicobacter pylori]|uniref:hypothetical protein n=1 Tax=Helicobacter pylori TaxID=210 RepID=UPI000EB0627F|nr:hypothetical protein [Helicobacter pylori]RKV16344.1 hypothetical protein DD749_07260 [Helicobacter pylori]